MGQSRILDIGYGENEEIKRVEIFKNNSFIVGNSLI